MKFRHQSRASVMNFAANRAVVRTMFRKVSLVIFASSASSGVNQDERALNGAGQVKKKKQV